MLTLFLFEKIILLIAICAGKAVNRDSINTKVFEEERVGVGGPIPPPKPAGRHLLLQILSQQLGDVRHLEALAVLLRAAAD
ncbi:MAG: hypothetical protein Q3X91_14890, partial [Bilophila sp.]|nr:hypothetical protein [Bilophila sp.]